MSSVGMQGWARPWIARRYAAAVAVGAIMAAAFGIQAALALVQPAPWIFPDELIYSELAKGIAESGIPSIRGSSSWDYGPIYPLLISPAWLVDDGWTAFVVVHLINALLMTLAIPLAYLVARRFVAPKPALVVAVMTALMPSMLYVGTILTEVVLFPCFLLVVLAMCAALERPSARSQVLVLLAIGLATLVKPLALVLVPAWIASIVIEQLLTRPASLRAALGRFRATWLAVGVGACAAAAIVVGGGLSLSAALGSYSVVLGNVDVTGIPHWLVLHLAGLDLYVVAAPLAASMLVLLLAPRRDSPKEMRRFVAVLAPTTALLLMTVAAYSSRPSAGAEGFFATSARLHERAMFVLAPLLFVGLALWLERGSPKPRRLYAPVLMLAALLPGVLPLAELRENANFQATALVPWLTFDDVPLWPAGAFVLGGVAVLLLHRASQAGSAFVWTLVAVWMTTVGLFVYGSLEASAEAAWKQSGASNSTWVDDAIPADADVVVLWVGAEQRFASTGRERTVWVTEFFNRRVGTVYWLGSPMSYALPAVEAELRGNVVYAGGRQIEAAFVLAPCPVSIRGDVVRRAGNGLTLIRTDGVVRADVGPLERCTTG